MDNFNTSLVREKIVFTEGDKEPTVIRSNRIFLKLGEGAHAEKVVIRAQNMHTTLRVAAKILFSYFRHGLILPRTMPFDWDGTWDTCLNSYEKEFNPRIWAAIYINGKSVFKTTTSPFVDIIEKCALLTVDNYDATMDVTESALKKIGHAVRISHTSNVATVFTDKGDSTRCGIIHRADNRDTTFNFTVSGGKQETRLVQTIGIASAYLDAFSLRFVIDTNQDKMRRGEIKKISPEANQMRAAIARQGAINKAIISFEESYDVKYRPMKPDFFDSDKE
jgi:hypothetical protein